MKVHINPVKYIFSFHEKGFIVYRSKKERKKKRKTRSNSSPKTSLTRMNRKEKRGTSK